MNINLRKLLLSATSENEQIVADQIGRSAFLASNERIHELIDEIVIIGSIRPHLCRSLSGVSYLLSKKQPVNFLEFLSLLVKRAKETDCLGLLTPSVVDGSISLESLLSSVSSELFFLPEIYDILSVTYPEFAPVFLQMATSFFSNEVDLFDSQLLINRFSADNWFDYKLIRPFIRCWPLGGSVMLNPLLIAILRDDIEKFCLNFVQHGANWNDELPFIQTIRLNDEFSSEEPTYLFFGGSEPGPTLFGFCLRCRSITLLKLWLDNAEVTLIDFCEAIASGSTELAQIIWYKLHFDTKSAEEQSEIAMAAMETVTYFLQDEMLIWLQSLPLNLPPKFEFHRLMSNYSPQPPKANKLF